MLFSLREELTYLTLYLLLSVVAKNVVKHPRVVSNVHVNKLPVQASRVIIDHTEKYVSVPPFNEQFPKFAPQPVSNFVWTASPWSNDFPRFQSAQPLRAIASMSTLDSDEWNPETSYHPWEAQFPKSNLHKHRRSKNRSERKHRHLVAEMFKYKKEHGPVNLRTWTTEMPKPVDNARSFSPWQEVDFAIACRIPLAKFIKAKNLKTLMASGQVPNKMMPKMYFKSVSPWTTEFPFMSEQTKRAEVEKLVADYKRASIRGTPFVMPSAPVFEQVLPVTARASLSGRPSVKLEGFFVPPPTSARAAVPAPMVVSDAPAKKFEAVPSGRASIKMPPGNLLFSSEKSPTAPLKATTFPAISPHHSKSHKRVSTKRMSTEEEAAALAAPFLNRFLMTGAL